MATDQNQNNVNPTGHSNPETAGDLGAVVRFATWPMTSTSMPNQADQSQNNQLNIWDLDSFAGWGEARTHGAYGIQRDDDGMNFQREDGAEHSQQTSQPNEARLSQQPLNQHQGGAEHSHQHQGGQSLVHRSNSLQSPSGGDQGDQFQAGQSNSLHSAMGGVPKLSHQHQVGPSLVHRSNSLQSTMGAVRLSEQLLNRAGQIHTDLSNPSQYTSDRMMRFEETRQLQWSQEEPCRDSGPTTCDKKLAAEERKKKTRSEYNEREKGKKVLSAEIFDKLKRGEDVRSQEYVHRIPEPPSKSKFQQQIHRPSYSAPAAVTNQTESHIYEDHHRDSGQVGQAHHGTDPGDVGQTGTGFEKVRTAATAVKQLSARVEEIKQIRENSSSWPQPNGPPSAQASLSTVEQLQHIKFAAQETIAADHVFQTRFSRSQMSNDDQVPHMRASTSSSAELPENFDAEDITAKGDNAKRGAEVPFTSII